MKSKKRPLLITLGIIAIVAVGVLIYLMLHDENKLTVEERTWINANLSTVQNINIINDLNIYAKDGHGVFYDFLTDFGSEYNLRMNPIISNDAPSNIFKDTTTITDQSLIFEEDHYVLVGKNEEIINRSAISNLSIGVLNSDADYIKSFLTLNDVKTYEDSASLFTAFNNSEINYLIVPRNKYLDEILTNNYLILTHLTEMRIYLVYEMDPNNIMSTIIKKYYNTWYKDNLDDSINRNTYTDFVDNLSLTNQELTTLTADAYNYGFISNSPYEILIGGNYGGIVGEYIKRFSDFSNVSFNFTKYKNNNTFTKAINNDKVDIYFDYYNINTNYQKINTNLRIDYVIIAPMKNDTVITSLESLRNKEVYALNNSPIIAELKKINNIKVSGYDDLNALFKLAKKDHILILDKETYNYYAGTKFKNYTLRYSATLDNNYNFKIKDNNIFAKIFKPYINYLDPEEIVTTGLYNHHITLNKGSLLGTLAKYAIYLIIGATVILYLIYLNSKKVTISKRIKKEDKMRYIDQMTSLKNRNYLNENLESWNKNTIYPQTTIIVDLNKIQEINDTLGHEEGDKQIKAAANILIKTQLDNSDIIRTSGNEFLIYLVEYNSRQVTNYIRKLNKEFKELPHDYGATITYSMILDDTKMIEDAINEAVDEMKIRKQETYDEE